MRVGRNYMMNLNTTLKNETNVRVLSRIKVLYYVVYEMANAFGVNEYALDSIKKGILERQIIKTMSIYYYIDSAEKPIAQIKITIDWDKHTVLAATEEGQSFNLNTEKSIHSQISEASDYIIEHVEQLRRAYPISKIRTLYRYIDAIESDEKKNQEAMEFLNHQWCKTPQLEENEEFTKVLTQEFEHLPELQLVVMSKK